MSLSNAPWKGKIEEENFADAIRYIFEQSKTTNDPFPSLIRLFKEDIGAEQDKLMAFSVLMKKLDIALNEKVGQKQFAEVLHILEKHFPNINEGVRLKCNFLSKKYRVCMVRKKITFSDSIFRKRFILTSRNDSF